MDSLFVIVKYILAATLAILSILSFRKALRLANPTAKTFIDQFFPLMLNRMYPFSSLNNKERFKRSAQIAAYQVASPFLLVFAFVIAITPIERLLEELTYLLCLSLFFLTFFITTTLQIYLTSALPRTLGTLMGRIRPYDFQIPIDKGCGRVLYDERFVLSIIFAGLGATVAVMITAVLNSDVQTSQLVWAGVGGALIGLPTGFAASLYLRKKST